ncbi:hypothetical protein BDN72DRAFT_836546 [Pluteus cervinus]|uniref:Uncharacterized protein n=1 Tax=Pluteus cervinus TaxID=181527 RepID=A0ACD3B1L2_9AGAR|nr:hypothetical protein BDN72DRAFT_836546 [Pluteus cervinus]
MVAAIDVSQHVLVSYAAPTMFLNSGSWRQIQEGLKAQLPLRNIHWKSASRTSIRTIQELDITLVNFETLRDEHTSQVPATLLEKPLLNIYILMCEDSDIDGYKNVYKKQIREWHATVITRKNQEWFILHIAKPDARAPTGNFFQLKGSVLDKVRADFNADKRDRCAQVPWTVNYESPTSWVDAINKIKDGIISAFDAAVAQREDEVRRSEGQSQMPGWNFCTFFILKESLPNSFEGVNMFEEALLQYDELEVSFSQVLREKNLSWFGSLITPGPKDDSTPLLQITKKSYRDLILANTISVFDLRVYLLARQCEILARMGKISEINKKASTFLAGFSRRIREVEDTLPPFFVESWVYSSALSVIEQCDLWILHFPQEGANLALFNAGKAELLELARHQLDIIGVRVGHLPHQPPFSTVVDSPEVLSKAINTNATKVISNEKLLSALGNAEAFYELYVATSNRAIELYAKAGRRKFALKLHGSLAALDLHRSRIDSAFTTYSSLPAHYAPHMWTSLESFMLSRALDTHAALGKPKDTEWIHILLSFLKVYVECEGNDLLLHGEEKIDYVRRLITEMRQTAKGLATELPHADYPALSVMVANEVRPATTQDGAFLDVTIINKLPCSLPIDSISVQISGRDAERFKFTASKDALEPGKNEVTLFCPTAAAGTYLLDTSEIRSALLLFQMNHRKSQSKTRSKRDSPVLVKIPKDFLSLDIKLLQPTRIELGRPSVVLVRISTGRNDVKEMTLKLSASGVTFNMNESLIEDEDEDEDVELETSNDCIKLSGLSEDQTLEVIVPHSDASAMGVLKTNIQVEYSTNSEPDVQRILNLSRTIVTALPISINVEDFFRGPKLLSRFTISTTTQQFVRIADAQLVLPEEGADGLKIQNSMTRNRSVLTVTPAQPANFLFQLESTGGAIRDPLSLVVKYRMLREEVESLVEDTVDDLLEEKEAPWQLRAPLINKLIAPLGLDGSWIELYRVTGEIHISGSFDTEEGEIGDLLKEGKERLSRNKHVLPPPGPWHEIIIPVDVPSIAIVAAARISLSPPTRASEQEHDTSLYAGQPVPATITIHTTFHWGSSANDTSRRYRLRFDVEEMVKDWLVSGQKRGDFVVADDSTHTVSITLVALHHGELVLPKIIVSALPIAGELTMGSLAIPTTESYQEHGAERVLVLPRGGRSTFVVGMGSG